MTAATTDGAVLRAAGIGQRFGGVVALDDVSFSIHAGRVTGLIGPNGSGKSTMVNALTGHRRPSSGRVLLRGNDVTSKRPDQIAALGVGRGFQTPRLFPSLTALENVAYACEAADRVVPRRRLLAWRMPAAARTRALGLLDDLGIAGLAHRGSRDLGVGEARRVEIARALAVAQTVLILDEPLAGIRGAEAADVGALVRRVCEERGLAILLIEHNVELMRQMCDELIALNFGKIIAAGDPESVISSPEVVEAYIGPNREERR